MLTSERKMHLLNLLREHGRIVAKTVADQLALSEDTIRRDLRELANDGMLMRVHGGALPASPSVVTLDKRRFMSTAEKQKLGKLGAELISKAATVFIDGGTTNLEVVRALSLNTKAHIFTHSPTIAAELVQYSGHVTIIGGRLDQHSMVAVGAVALNTIMRLRIDLFLVGATGFHSEEGLTTGNEEEAAMKQAISAQAAETIALLTSDKLGTVSRHLIIKPEELSAIGIVGEAKITEGPELLTRIIRAV